LKKFIVIFSDYLPAAATFAAQTITWTDYASNPLTIPIPAGFSRAYMPTVVYNASWAKPYRCGVTSVVTQVLLP
jgi:hypothetical protein